MLELIIVIVVVSAIAANSFNPFLMLRKIVGGAGFIFGATPKAFEAGKELTKQLHLEAQVELVKGGKDQERAWVASKYLGNKVAKEMFDPMIEVSQTKQSILKEEVAKLRGL